jgi:hypothetical protein
VAKKRTRQEIKRILDAHVDKHERHHKEHEAALRKMFDKHAKARQTMHDKHQDERRKMHAEILKGEGGADPMYDNPRSAR